MPESGPILACLAVLTALSLPQCSKPAGTSVPTPTPVDDKIARFEAWRSQKPAVDLVDCHAFFTANWYQTDGRTHFFVSELVSFELAHAAAATAAQSDTVEKLARTFREKVRALVAAWPDRPKIGDDFGERHVTTDRDAAEAAHNDFLAHRHNDTIEIHRLWIR